MNDFHTLNKPEEDMHDRTRIPRMPWLVVYLESEAHEIESTSLGTTWGYKFLGNQRET